MEQDRFQKNHVLYIIGLISLVASLSLFAFTLYILPHLIFGWGYDAPVFISSWKEILRFGYHFSSSAASQLIALLFFILTVIFAIIAYFSSNRIDNEIYSAELEFQNKSPKRRKGHRESVMLVLKLLFIIFLVFIFAELFQWLIYTKA